MNNPSRSDYYLMALRHTAIGNKGLDFNKLKIKFEDSNPDTAVLNPPNQKDIDEYYLTQASLLTGYDLRTGKKLKLKR